MFRLEIRLDVGGPDPTAQRQTIYHLTTFSKSRQTIADALTNGYHQVLDLLLLKDKWPGNTQEAPETYTRGEGTLDPPVEYNPLENFRKATMEGTVEKLQDIGMLPKWPEYCTVCTGKCRYSQPPLSQRSTSQT